MRFTLEIQLGNDAMQTTRDLQRALQDLARDFRNDNLWDTNAPLTRELADDGRIYDENGNRVGRWEIGE
jgi:hypothetical protein